MTTKEIALGVALF